MSAPVPVDLVTFTSVTGARLAVRRDLVRAIVDDLHNQAIPHRAARVARVYADLPASALSAGGYVLVDLEEGRRLAQALSLEVYFEQVANMTAAVTKKVAAGFA